MGKHTLLRTVCLFIIIIGLLGVSYAGWTDIGKMVANITTGSMDYDFLESENQLVLVRDSSTVIVPASITVEKGKYLRIDILDAGPIMNMTAGDKLRIYYKFKDDKDGNVPLMAKDEDLGLISIDLKKDTIRCDLSGGDYNVSDYISMLPENLGVYQVHHSFGMAGGTIDFTPVSLPAKPVDSITYDYSKAVDLGNDEVPEADGYDQEQIGSAGTGNLEPDELSKEDSKQSGMDEHNNVIEHTDMESLTAAKETEAENDADSIKSKNDKRDKKTERKLQISCETISLSAEYGFTIPLRLDQYNAGRNK